MSTHGLSKEDFRARHSTANQELKDQVRQRDNMITQIMKEHGKLEVFFDQVMSAITPIEPLKSVYKPSKNKATSPITSVMQISDAHMGSVQLASEIENFNEYNPDVCRKRQIMFAEKTLDWVSVQRNGYYIPELVVLVTGDLISGDIHEEFRVTNAFPSPVQVVKAAEVLAEQMTMVSPHFNKVTVHFISEDNHARLTKKPQAKEAGYNSLNYLVGMLAKAYLMRIPNLEFNIYPVFEQVVNVNNRLYLIAHGHNVKGWAGIPFYGIERKVAREAVARLEIIMHEQSMAKTIGFHKYVFGHWHISFDMPMYMCAASVQGTDAYDHKNARFSFPSQPVWMVHPKHPEFNRTNFILI